jgi:hypothetical protein
MKNQKSNKEEYKSVKEYTKNEFSEIKLEKLIVSEKQQLDEIEKLKIGLRHEQFFFIVNVENFSIITANGLEEIGFHSETFDMMQYAQLLPSHGILQMLTLYWKKIFEFNIQEKSLLSFLKPKYIVQIPFKNAKGEIMLVKRTISPFQFTESRRLTQYLSEFTIIKKSFDSEAPEPRFTDIPTEFDGSFNAIMKESFEWDSSPFSPKEMVILKVYADDEGKSSLKELADKCELKPSTLQFYNKEILMHTKDFLGDIYKFQTAKEVANFFKKCGVLK